MKWLWPALLPSVRAVSRAILLSALLVGTPTPEVGHDLVAKVWLVPILHKVISLL